MALRLDPADLKIFKGGDDVDAYKRGDGANAGHWCAATVIWARRNPQTAMMEYDVVYEGLDGQEAHEHSKTALEVVTRGHEPQSPLGGIIGAFAALPGSFDVTVRRRAAKPGIGLNDDILAVLGVVLQVSLRALEGPCLWLSLRSF